MKRLEDLGFKIVKEGLEMYEKNQQSLVLETKGRSDWFTVSYTGNEIFSAWSRKVGDFTSV